jgi:ketosteroid isomerase-like protein
MSTTTSSTTLDLGVLGRAIETRDAHGQLAHYADDAVIEVVDRDHPPSTPLRVEGRDAIRAYLEDVYGRDIAHSVRHAFESGDKAALWIDCAYPDGTQVRCACACVVREGKIARQDILQEWDG